MLWSQPSWLSVVIMVIVVVVVTAVIVVVVIFVLVVVVVIVVVAVLAEPCLAAREMPECAAPPFSGPSLGVLIMHLYADRVEIAFVDANGFHHAVPMVPLPRAEAVAAAAAAAPAASPPRRQSVVVIQVTGLR